MVDTRFHTCTGPSTLGALLRACAPALGADGEADSLVVAGAEELTVAGPEHVALAAHRSYRDDLRATRAGVVVVSPELREDVPAGTFPLVVERPHEVFADLLAILYPDDTRRGTGGLAPSAKPICEDGVTIGPNVVIGAGVEIGKGTVIGANTVVGAGVAIGRNCIIAANCTIDCAYLGDNVVLHSGVRVGCEGFGWLDLGRRNRKIPQLGRVIVQDRVEIGANSTVDRGALGDTVIGEGSKIDNLVQIGHNCRIGRNCLIAAQSGLSGSTVLEDGVLLGGGVGTAGHLTIGAGTVVHGRAAVSKSWPAGSNLIGAPAQDVKGFWRETAMLRRLSKGERR